MRAGVGSARFFQRWRNLVGVGVDLEELSRPPPSPHEIAGQSCMDCNGATVRFRCRAEVIVGQVLLAEIEYHGVAGSSADCLEAVERLLHYRTCAATARIITSRDEPVPAHGILITTFVGDVIAIKAGFTSGYGGQGPHEFSSALSLFQWHGVELEEIEVTQAILDRLNRSALTRRDLNRLTAGPPLRPQRLWNYLSEKDYEAAARRNPWRGRRNIIPLSIIDDRLGDLAGAFWDDPDGVLMKMHRRLESMIRQRASIDPDDAPTPTKAFAIAFNVDAPRLGWPDIPKAERQGRANLFSATLMAFRNARAHREGVSSGGDQLAEFLLLNLLFRLERDAVRQTV